MTRFAAQGMHAFAEDVGIDIPEINDPHETPFYDRAEIVVGEITAIEPSIDHTIPERASRWQVSQTVGAAAPMAFQCIRSPLAQRPENPYTPARSLGHLRSFVRTRR